MSAVNTLNPIIFIGSGRSGTTLIFEIICKHESLAWPSNYNGILPSIPALNFIRRVFQNKFWNLSGQKRQLNKAPFFNAITFKPAENYRLWDHIIPSNINFRRGFLLEEKATAKEAKKINGYFLKMIKYQGKERLTFKITGPSRIGYLKSIFPDAVFVNIIRDPLPTINSWLNVDFWNERGKQQLWWKGAYTNEEENYASDNKNNAVKLAAIQYKKLMEVTAKEVAQYNVSCLTIRYEDFLENPAVSINSILQFCNLKTSAQVNAYLKNVQVYNQNKNYEKAFTAEDINDVQTILSNQPV